MARAESRREVRRPEPLAAVAAEERRGPGPSAARVLDDPWGSGAREVAVAPLHQREQSDAEVAALVGQHVLVPLGPLVVARALEDAGVDEPREAVAEDVSRDAEAALEIVEAPNPEEGVADDQERPALADQ